MITGVNPEFNTHLKLTEAELSELWLGQRFPPQALVLHDGTRIQVVYRGRPSSGPGPDFRDAVVAYPDATLRKGDIELHVHTSDFRAHGHHIDPAYNNLVLHVVFENNGEPETRLPNGRTIPIVALGDWVASRAQQLESWLRRPPLWEEPCHDAVDRMGEAEVASTLDRLGMIRFRAKTAALAHALAETPADEVLYREIIRAVNFGGNEDAAVELAMRLPWHEFCRTVTADEGSDREIAATELLLEAAGLRTGPRRVMDGKLWRSWGMRPENHPTRRLTGCAALLVRTVPEGPVVWARLLLSELTSDAANNTSRSGSKKTASALIDRLIVEVKAHRSALIGRARAIEIAFNAILPFIVVYAAANDHPVLAKRAETIACALPSTATYGATRIVYEYQKDARGRAIANTALRNQGLLYLSHNYCTQGGCGKCPLSEGGDRGSSGPAEVIDGHAETK
jgi:hypothetical protein